MASPPVIPQLFRLIGSKARMVNTITTTIPPGTKVLVSLFLGSGVFEYNYARSHPECRVVCFDLDPAVVNFHRQALKHRLALHAAIQTAHHRLCDSSGTLDKACYQRLRAEHGQSPGQGGLEAAARFYLLSAYSFSGKLGSYAAKRKFLQPSGLLHALPRNLSVRQGDALGQLARLCTASSVGTCLYLDPPYMLGRSDYYARSDRSLDHGRMATLLSQVDDHGGRWVLSYNDVPGVRCLYTGHAGWTRLRLPLSQPSIGVWKAELIITNWRLTLAQQQCTRDVFKRDNRRTGAATHPVSTT